LSARAFSYEADVLIRIGQFDRAVASARRALALAQEMGAESERAVLLPGLAQALLAAGDIPEAHRAIQEAVELYRRLAGAERPLPPEAQQVLGEVLLARGDAAGAQAALEQTLAAWEEAGVSPISMAPTRFALARALRLGHKDSARARELATAARDALAPTPEPRRIRLADIDAFLRAP
jgi:tetratricopeptide (TPR) repeat protein